MTYAPPDWDNASLDAQLDETVDHHRAGRLFEAEEIYRRITREKFSLWRNGR